MESDSAVPGFLGRPSTGLDGERRKVFGGLGTDYRSHRRVIRPADLVALESLCPVPEIVEKIAESLFGAHSPRFAVFELPLSLFGETRDASVDHLHLLASHFTFNLLEALLPHLRFKLPLSFRQFDYFVPRRQCSLSKFYRDKCVHPLHWDQLKSCVIGLTYHKDDSLRGGEALVGDLVSFLRDFPGDYPFEIWPAHLPRWGARYRTLLSDYTVTIPLSSTHMTVLIVNNAIDPRTDGCLHGAAAAEGSGWRRLRRCAISDRSYQGHTDKLYVSPPFEPYLSAAQCRDREIFLAGNFAVSEDLRPTAAKLNSFAEATNLGST